MIQVVNVISDTNIGGAGKCLLTYLRHADRDRFKVSVVLPKGSLLKPLITELGYPVFEIDAMTDQSLDRRAIRQLKELFSVIKPDIVHSHASMSARIAARSVRGCKIVYTRHSVFEPSARISRGIGKLINGMINNHYADGIIAVADAAKQNLIATGVSPKKIRVILNGVDPVDRLDPVACSLAREHFGIGVHEPVVAIIARLTPVKGHRYLLEAIRLLKEKDIRARFVIAGTGEAEHELRALARQLDILDRVTFAGFLSDVTPLYNIMTIQVNASYGTEATSLSLLEGMSLGIPAVVSDFGGNPGVITDLKNGLITPQRDAPALARALARLLTDHELYHRLTAGAKAEFDARFQAPVMCRSIESFYESLLSHESGHLK